jgi:hypothetical protein
VRQSRRKKTHQTAPTSSAETWLTIDQWRAAVCSSDAETKIVFTIYSHRCPQCEQGQKGNKGMDRDGDRATAIANTSTTHSARRGNNGRHTGSIGNSVYLSIGNQCRSKAFPWVVVSKWTTRPFMAVLPATSLVVQVMVSSITRSWTPVVKADQVIAWVLVHSLAV